MKNIFLLTAILFSISVYSQTATWFQQESGTTNSLKSIHFIDFQNAYSVGTYGTALRTNNAGSTWNEITVNTNEDLLDVFFVNDQTGWIVGNSSTVLKTTNGGDAWTDIVIPFNDQINTVFFIDENTGWLGVENKDSVLYTTDQGANWGKSKIMGTKVRDIFFISNTIGWLINDVGIFNTTDGGISWNSQLNVGAYVYGTSIYFIDANNGWATGTDNKIWHTSNGGTDWETQNTNLESQDDIYEICFADINNGTAVATLSGNTEGCILSTTDGGNTWLADYETSDKPLVSVDIFDENTIYVSGTQGRIYRKQAKQEICIVLVDSLSGKNKIVWKKMYNQATEKYKIYKLVGSNYVFLAEQQFNDLTEYIDYSSTPTSVAARYKITTIDSLGNESEQSPYHQTIHLSIAEGVPNTTAELSWNIYEDESGEFVPDWYYIYRGTTPENIAVFDSVSAAFTSFSDENTTEQHYYTIAVKKENACESEGTAKTRATGGPYSQSSSNMEDYAFNTGSGINNIDAMYGKINIYPNPTSNNLHFTINNVQLFDDAKIIITDVAGRNLGGFENLRGLTSGEITIDVSKLESGTYFITINGDKLYRGKFVKQ